MSQVALRSKPNDNRTLGFVYIWTNLINGKKYIGSHKGTPDDGYIGSGKHFNRALEKHGIENFERNLLYIGESYKVVEQCYLKIVDAANDKKFYNIINYAHGGSEKGNINPNYG